MIFQAKFYGNTVVQNFFLKKKTIERDRILMNFLSRDIAAILKASSFWKEIGHGIFTRLSILFFTYNHGKIKKTRDT